MRLLASVVVAVGLVAGLCLPAGAAVNVGDEPAMEFVSTDGAPVSFAKLRGKMIVVDFWATWCGPCMAEAEHMVQINNKYGPQGLQFIGISLDRDKAKMIEVSKAKGFVWPQFIDGTDGQRFGSVWGVTGIPSTFIISPAGKVLWKGHPAEIDGPLEQAFKQHPPQMIDPKVLATAKEAVDTAEQALKAGNTKGALAAMAKVPNEAKADKDFATRADAVRQSLDAAAEKMLTDVEPLITDAKYVDAVARLRELTVALASSPVGAKAKRRLDELSAKPEVKTALAKADRAKQSDAALAVAQQMKADKKDEQAYLRFKGVAKDFADTPAGAKAAAAAKEYEKDAAFIKRVNESGIATKATSLMKVAQSYAGAGRGDLARKKYQEVISQFPGTSYAEQAKKAMAALPQ